MKHVALGAISLFLLIAVLWGGASIHRSADFRKLAMVETIGSKLPSMEACYAPGTSDDYMARVERSIHPASNLDFNLSNRWHLTATDGPTGSEGNHITLTYSFIPDGVSISDNWGTGPSVLFARLNQEFGNQAAWQSKFAQIFAEWTRLTGVHYVLVTDDGAAFPSAAGSLGFRGDVRIGSKALDGVDNVLAYDYYPNNGGDMVLDASENWAAAGGNYIFMRNILAHEHGHGLGIAHVCPIDETKLLEPFYTPNFDGPQHDDIRAANRYYGDSYDPNSSAASAYRIGAISQDTVLQNLSIDHLANTDYWWFAVPAGKGFDLTLNPVGHTYLSGPQNQDGTCSAGSPVNSLNSLNLDLFLYNSAGTTLLAQSNTNPAGVAKIIRRYSVSLAGDSFAAKVMGSGSDQVQMYELQFNIFNLADPVLSVAQIAFDSTRINATVDSTVYLLNDYITARQITGIHTSTPAFTVTPAGPLTIPAHDSVAVTVTFHAVSVGEQLDTLVVNHDGPGGPVMTPLSGTTTDAQLVFVRSDTVNFGSVPINTLDSSRIPLRCNGNIPLTITGFTVAPPFSIVQELPISLEPTQAVFLRPRFQPTQAGPVEGIMLVQHTGSNSPDTVHLIGIGGTEGVDDLAGALPSAYSLRQNYPNPFNPTTEIAFDLPRLSRVRVTVYDIQGRLVQELVNGELDAGRHSVAFNGANLASGLYFYRLSAPGFTAMNKMVLMK